MAGKGRPSPRDKDRKSTGSGGNESELATQGGWQAERSASQLSHQSHTRSSHSQIHSSHSHTHSVYSHAQSNRSQVHSQNSHTFSYSHAPYTQYSHVSCAYSDRSHASSYGPPGLPPPYSLVRLAPKTSVSSCPPGAPPVRELGAVPPELTASRQSFQHAMGNPCEFFVDIM